MPVVIAFAATGRPRSLQNSRSLRTDVPVRVLGPHDKVDLRHPPQQRLALLLRHAARHHNLQGPHIPPLAFGLHGGQAHSDIGGSSPVVQRSIDQVPQKRGARGWSVGFPSTKRRHPWPVVPYDQHTNWRHTCVSLLARSTRIYICSRLMCSGSRTCLPSAEYTFCSALSLMEHVL